MKCLDDSCLREALEDSNYCNTHRWNENVERYSPGGGDTGETEDRMGDQPDDRGKGGDTPLPGDQPGSGGLDPSQS